MMRTRWTLTWMLLAGLWTSSLHAQTPADTKNDAWYTLLLGGQPAGWMHTVERIGNDRIESMSSTQISLRRGEIALQIAVDTRFAETPDGKPIEAEVTQKLAAMSVRQLMRFTDHDIEMTITQGDQSQTQHYGLPQQPWLAPAASQRYLEEQIRANQETVSYWTMDPASGPTLFQVQMRKIGPVDTEVLGKVVPGIAWKVSMSQLPGIIVSTVTNERGLPLRFTMTPMPGFEFTVIASDEQLAKAQVNPPELMVSTLVSPDRPITSARSLRRAVYELEITPGDPGMAKVEPSTLPVTGVQRVERRGDLVMRVSVDMDHPASSVAEAPGDNYLRATSSLNIQDPVVVDLAQQAVSTLEKDAGDAVRAEAMRKFVHGFINTKDLAVGSATASEVARVRQGDCSEHATLLAALLRAQGIPSRTVSGLLYVDAFLGKKQVFGYHMWAEAWLRDTDGKGRWVDLDAILGDDLPFDATHIALGVSDMSDDRVANDMLQLVPLIGRFKIKIIEPEDVRP
ncbi:MAG: transglutaminase domain-containing protein [Phycisphaeraceae bacterium]|nr:transglutaminase domain-containing protein [Phycisphaeraceae bacterium]